MTLFSDEDNPEIFGKMMKELKKEI